ncbi:permease-like cell division protein FtsX [Asanoa siamensis]|uniref:permease-like cell division protein FtsX n=1 Tax=Asanoa siamensis TaxID=926357 RepID=UPI00194142E3|nr:permease-like cell division protein FtsX [Asanoa siamensis]
MDQDLKQLFDRALADEPDATPADLAGRAVSLGLARRRSRRRKALVAGGAGATLAAALVVANLAPQRGDPPLRTVPAEFASQINPVCQSPALDGATDLSVFLLPEITDEQRVYVHDLLLENPAAHEVRYESRDEAYARFKRMFSDAPALVEAVKPSHLPESFRVKLTLGSGIAGLTRQAEQAPGVETVIDSRCPAGADVAATP